MDKNTKRVLGGIGVVLIGTITTVFLKNKGRLFKNKNLREHIKKANHMEHMCKICGEDNVLCGYDDYCGYGKLPNKDMEFILQHSDNYYAV